MNKEYIVSKVDDLGCETYMMFNDIEECMYYARLQMQNYDNVYVKEIIYTTEEKIIWESGNDE